MNFDSHQYVVDRVDTRVVHRNLLLGEPNTSKFFYEQRFSSYFCDFYKNNLIKFLIQKPIQVGGKKKITNMQQILYFL